MREECRLRVHVKRMLRKIFGPKRGGGNGENYIMGSLLIYTPHPRLFG